MKELLITSLFLFFISQSIDAQEILVQPYLQDATPTSIHILWETSVDDVSSVEWGLTSDLGNITTGTSAVNQGSSMIHNVKLEGLSKFTKYYYKVVTGITSSPIHSFKTPPFSSDNESFRLVAMSDVQRDGNNPNKFMEVAQDGVMTYLENKYDADLPENLALVMIPGDLVNTGSNYNQWLNQFFAPSGTLFSQVPMYPVLGNHEANAQFYFNYFDLPDNGSPDYEEHWWYTDYSNTRIIGLDSNGPFNNNDQLDWLENLLLNTCTSDSIDFVFVQVHHPHKSELWTPGESGFTGEVIERLENFSTTCGKPSIHFFGHTHGYSRGQSRDHKHLWINVASGGGYIDYWGEWPQFDYDEFSVSQDEWGFVLIDVSAGDDPTFTVKRISRGDDQVNLNNEIRDSMVVRMLDESLEKPIAIFPINEMVNPNCIVLKASQYPTMLNSANHGQSHWQLSDDCNDFSNPIKESWKNYENWYFDEDTQAEDDLTDEKMTNLNELSDYCWRVRYRDRELNWSDWSEPAAFSTSSSTNSPNLLINPGAEMDTDDWQVLEGNLELLTSGECDGINPNTGIRYYAVGGVCEDAPYGKSVQVVDVSMHAEDIDDATLQVNWGGYLSNFSGSDLPEIKLYFLDSSQDTLGETETHSTLNSNWTLINEWASIPEGTRQILFSLMGTRNAGADNDSYFDDLILRLGVETEDCDEFVSSNNNIKSTTGRLTVEPNPFSHKARVILQSKIDEKADFKVFNALGQQVNCSIQIHSNEIIIERGSLESGLYFFQLFENSKLVAKGNFVVI